ncbi:MAG: type IX secretion system plug protein domain-containing protein [Balneolaceae bacterium]
MKANFTCNSYILTLLVMLAAAGCKPFEQNDDRAAIQDNGPSNAFNVPGQVVMADSVFSIRLARKGNPGSAPFLNLNGSGQLHLQFEILEFDSRQLRISFTHHNPDWSRSSLPPEFYQEGFYTLYLDAGQVSQNQRPDYRQYSYEFPNDQVSFRRSGNYMLRIEDTQTGHLLFTLPFFVFENEGSVTSSIETRQVPRQNHRISHRPVSRYELPGFVEQPLFDLEFYYVQNQFWGRSRQAGELDFSDEHDVQFELSSEQSFTGDYEFLHLPLNSLSQTNSRIYEADPTQIPPLVHIYDDAEGFAAGRSLDGRYGRPDPGIRSSYANVIFTLDPEQDFAPKTEIYLTGDFNNWSIRADNRLRYNSGNDRWQTSAIIKQGQYNYKYVLLQNGKIDDLAFDDLFARGRQEYHAMVYMHDSQQFYYRLLQINHFYEDF